MVRKALILFIIPSLLFPLTLTLKKQAVVNGQVRLLDLFTADGKVENPTVMPMPSRRTTLRLSAIMPMVNMSLASIELNAVGSSIDIIPGDGAGASVAAAGTASSSGQTERAALKRDTAPVIETHAADAMPTAEGTDEKPDAWKQFVTEKLIASFVRPEQKKDEFRVKFLYKLPEVTVRNGDTLSFNFGQGKIIGTQRIRVDVLSPEGKRINWFETLVEVYTVKTVLVAKAYIDKNTTVTPVLFEAREFRSDRIPADSITDAAELANRMTKYYIKRDNIVRRFHLADTLAVHKGDMVDVHLKDGAIALTVKAQAQSDAGENMRLTLRNAATKREMQGIVRQGIVYVAK